MTMPTINDLERVITDEAEFAESLLEVVLQQQQAIVRFNAHSLGQLVEKQQEMLRPFEAMEARRASVSKEVVNAMSRGGRPAVSGSITLTEVLRHLDGEDASRVAAVGTRLRKAIENVLSANRKNRLLLEHSLKFVRENIRLLTDGFARQLIDEKM
jgi:flagellar biosynthesis/type III secretory pathway chaperone